MYIILRLVCEKLGRLAFKISFLWGPKHGVYAAASFSANVTSLCSRNGPQNFTSVILCMSIIFIAQRRFGGNSEILHCSDVFAQYQTLCKPESIFKQTRVNFFLPQKYDVISQLRHSYAKGPFLILFCPACLLVCLSVIFNLNFAHRNVRRDVTSWIGWQRSHHCHPLLTRQKLCFNKG